MYSRREDGITWTVDDEVVAESAQSPSCPRMLILGAFDIPRRPEPGVSRTFDVRLVRD